MTAEFGYWCLQSEKDMSVVFSNLQSLVDLYKTDVDKCEGCELEETQYIQFEIYPVGFGIYAISVSCTCGQKCAAVAREKIDPSAV